MSIFRRVVLVTVLTGFFMLGTASAQVLLTSGLQGASGSTLGPDGALYVTEGAIGTISRVDPWSGDATPFWEGLPPSLVGIGGVVDVAFLDGVAYALVTLVAPDVGGADTVGIYRMEGPNAASVIADIGAFSIANPPSTDFFIPTGVQYAMDTFRGGFLVTDGHHNRLLWVTLDGTVSEFNTFDNIVPTGLEIHGKTIYMAELGPAPNDPEDGRVVAFTTKSLTPWEVVSGVRMMVDVERGLGRTLYALGQGIWDGVMPGSPALPNTGELVQVNSDGSFEVIASGLNQPTSMEFIGNTVFIVSLAGDIWVIEGVSSPPFGRPR
jgi:hypothetical protein